MRALAALLVLLLGVSGMPARAATAIYTITAKKVNVREQPDTESGVLAVLGLLFGLGALVRTLFARRLPVPVQSVR